MLTENKLFLIDRGSFWCTEEGQFFTKELVHNNSKIQNEDFDISLVGRE